MPSLALGAAHPWTFNLRGSVVPPTHDTAPAYETALRGLPKL